MMPLKNWSTIFDIDMSLFNLFDFGLKYSVFNIEAQLIT